MAYSSATKNQPTRRTKAVQTVLPQSRVTDLLTLLHGRISGGHLDINETLDKVRKQYNWLHARSGAGRATPVQLVAVPELRIGVQMHQQPFKGPFERTTIGVAWPFSTEIP
jgi:hypothetical protein